MKTAHESVTVGAGGTADSRATTPGKGYRSNVWRVAYWALLHLSRDFSTSSDGQESDAGKKKGKKKKLASKWSPIPPGGIRPHRGLRARPPLQELSVHPSFIPPEYAAAR